MGLAARSKKKIEARVRRDIMSKPMRSNAAVLLAGVMIDGQGGRQVLVPVWSWVRTLPRQAMLFWPQCGLFDAGCG